MKYLVACCLTLFFGVSVAFAQDFNLVGKLPAPNLTLTTIDGKTVNTQDLRGKVIVYNFWFVGCPPCMEEIPRLNEIVDQYQGKDVVFLALSSSSKADVSKFVQKNPFKYQLIPEAAALMLGSYGETSKDGNLKIAFPTHVVISREGLVKVKVTGIKGVEAVREELKKEFEGK